MLKKYLIISSLVITATLSGCSEQKRSLTVANVTLDWFNAPLTIAIKELSSKTQIHANYFDVASGLASKVTVLSGSADIGLAAPIPLLLDKTALEEILVLGCYMSSGHVIGIASKSTGEAAQPIGYVPGTISEVFLANYLAKGGSNIASAEVVTMRPPDSPNLLRNNSVNSTAIWEPHLTRSIQDGVTIERSLDIYTVDVCLITSRSAMREKESEILEFSKLVEEGSQYIYSNPNEAREKIESWSGLEDGFLKDIWFEVDFNFKQNRSDVTSIFDDENAALAVAGFVDKAIDFSTMLELLEQ